MLTVVAGAGILCAIRGVGLVIAILRINVAFLGDGSINDSGQLAEMDELEVSPSAYGVGMSCSGPFCC